MKRRLLVAESQTSGRRCGAKHFIEDFFVFSWLFGRSFPGGVLLLLLFGFPASVLVVILIGLCRLIILHSRGLCIVCRRFGILLAQGQRRQQGNAGRSC